ncbi:Cof-type HAD-IIB family hydrolase [Acholeplasma sp. OttesenSCG-928-E16]|nr:Cof-type HAD-IIB family hydrolase [Acholeplasma sp. OttesenSCG-928-E16]
MRKIYCFDLDNTLLSRENKIVPKNTIKLLKKIKEDPNNILILATGRRPAEIKIIADIEHFFDYLVFLNGAIIIHQGMVIYRSLIDNKDIKKMINKAFINNLSFGLTSFDEEFIINIKEQASLRWDLPNGYQTINENFIPINHEIFQTWLLESKREIIDDFISEFKNFRTYYWHQGGAHFVYKNVNKAAAVLLIKERYPDSFLIAAGDGHNDIEMIDIADVGIAMGNSSNEELKEKANLIAPLIDDDLLYDFFQKNKLI